MDSLFRALTINIRLFILLCVFTASFHSIPRASAEDPLVLFQPRLTVDYSCRSYSSYDPIAGYPQVAGSFSVAANASSHYVHNGKLGSAGTTEYQINLDLMKTSSSTLVCRAGLRSSNSANRSTVYSEAGASDSLGQCALSLPGKTPVILNFHNGSTSNMGQCRLTFR